MKKLALPGLGLMASFAAGWAARGGIVPAEAAPPQPIRAESTMSCCSESAFEKPIEVPSQREVVQHGLALTVSIRAGDRYGSGVIASRDGLILTAQHVVGSQTAVEVRRLHGRSQRAAVVDSDEDLDVALLRLTELSDLPEVARPIELSTLRSGDEVFSVGSPRRLEFSVDRGIVSFAGREIFGLKYLQTDLPANQGSSGGPILDTQGRVVALSTFVVRDSERLAFGLPIEYVYARFAEQLGPMKVSEWATQGAIVGARHSRRGG
ncbi:MAG: trypsin-like peptidase domain-containing protein [Deltaproteobacteria bacterium]|nr:trypsin-like peptidase domain-containing protein [Deltaproteobacteria bacterium]